MSFYVYFNLGCLQLKKFNSEIVICERPIISHFNPLPRSSTTKKNAHLHAGNQIGAAGAAAVANALEPRRNGDDNWTPSTGLTVRRLVVEWVLILMDVTQEK
jgi:hypothetical protein